MIRGNSSIQRKLTTAIVGTSIAVLLLTAAGFFSYELITFQDRMENYIRTVADIIAQNSASALGFEDPKVARETLSTVSVERNIRAAALYKTNGEIFVYWPTNAPRAMFPPRPGSEGFRMEDGYLIYFGPVEQGNVHEGTLYLKC